MVCARCPARSRLDWQRMNRIATRWLPPARIQHPHPGTRFGARTQGRSRQCPTHAGICAVGRQQRATKTFVHSDTVPLK
jgi:hypothetical protein